MGGVEPSSAISRALAEVGPRLKRLRTEHGVTLSALAEATEISKSTLSRLESGQRRPSLELLLPLRRRIRSRWTSWSGRRRSVIRGSG